MFLSVVLLCCVLHPAFHYYCVFGKRESLKRFIVEEGAKPAIFGSYSYDPVKQMFIPPPRDNDTSTTTDGITESLSQVTESQAELLEAVLSNVTITALRNGEQLSIKQERTLDEKKKKNAIKLRRVANGNNSVFKRRR